MATGRKGKKSQLELAIESLEAKRDVLELAITELQQQQQQGLLKRERAPKPRKVKAESRKDDMIYLTHGYGVELLPGEW